MTGLSPSAVRPTPAPISATSLPAAPRLRAVWRAMMFKEASELAPVTALAMLAWGLLLLAMLWNARNASSNGGMAGSAADVPLLQLTVVVGPLAALIIGVAQYFRESRPGRYGLLTHRPVSRAMLFWCKTAAGLGLYLPTIGVPILAAFWWASAPANMPLPFTWRMGLAPLADLLAGIPYYFVGVLVAQQMEGWRRAARLLTVAGPIIASVGEFTAPHFGWALVWIGTATILTAIAARGHFAAGGQYHALPRAPRAALGIMTFAALGLLLIVGMALLWDLLQPAAKTGVTTSTTIAYLADGEPVRIDVAPNRPTTVSDLSGKVMDWDRQNQLWYPTVIYSARDFNRASRSFHSPLYYFIPAFATDRNEIWYASMPATGGNYFVGFRPREYRRIGAIGADGLEPGVAAPRARLDTPLDNLRSNLNRGLLISAADTLYRLTEDGKLERVLRLADPILQLAQFNGWVESGRNQPVYTMVIAAQEIVVLTSGESPRVLFRYALPDAGKWDLAATRFESTGLFLVQMVAPRRATSTSPQPGRALYFKPDGTLDHEVASPPPHEEWNRAPSAADIVPRWGLPLLVPPVALHGTVATVRLMEPDAEPADFADFANGRTALVNGGAALLSAAGMWVLLRRRRLAGGNIWLWTILTLLLGPLGILLFWLTSGLPVVAACPQCATQHPVTDSRCPACGATPVASPRNGTEVFADAPATFH